MFNNKRMENQRVVCLQDERQHSNEKQGFSITHFNTDEFHKPGLGGEWGGGEGRQVGKEYTYM